MQLTIMKLHILTAGLAAALTSFVATTQAGNLISYTDSVNYAQGWPNGLEQLYFDGSVFSIAPFVDNNSTSHGWNIYNDISMMGPAGVKLWNWSSTFQWVTPGPLAKDTLLDSSATLGGNNYYFPTYSSSFSSQYWGIAYSVGGGSYDYGWLELSYDSSTKVATFVAAAINTTPNESIKIGDTGAASVPEPSALSLLAISLGGLVLVRRRRS
jgi:hypothetical protein